MAREIDAELSKWIGIGVMFGTIIGVLTDNIGLWLPIGIALGAGYGTQQSNKPGEDDDN